MPPVRRWRRLGLALRFRGLPVPGLPVPSEMWGAAALAARLTHGGEGPRLPRTASMVAQASRQRTGGFGW